MDPTFWFMKQKMSDDDTKNEPLESPFKKLEIFSKLVEPLCSNSNLNMTTCAICGRPQITVDVTSSQNAKFIEGYVVVYFEVASKSRFQDFEKKTFCDGNGGY